MPRFEPWCRRGCARLDGVFRRKATPTPQPAWRDRFDRARQLVVAQSPPPWMVDRLDALDALMLAAEADHTRIGTAVAGLDVDQATAELKAALRSQGPAPTPEQQRLVATLRARYESIHDLINTRAVIRRSIDQALAEVDLLAVRSVELGARAERWQLDDTVARLQIEMTALEQAHHELADL
jgi:hypothetical protein